MKVFICEDLTNLGFKLFKYAKEKFQYKFIRDNTDTCKKDGKHFTINNLDGLFLTGHDNVNYEVLETDS